MHKLQIKLLEFAEQNNGKELSLRQIAREIGESHPQTAKYHLGQLEKKGLVIYHSDTRILTKIGYWDNSNVVSIPVLGNANCGEPTFFAEENFEGHLKVSKKLLKKIQDVYAVKAHGSSMNRASVNGVTIENGDYVLIDPSNRTPKESDYVLSFIDGVANIKKFYTDASLEAIVLVSESSEDHHPIYIHKEDLSDYVIGGSVLQVIKSPN